jgi:hypothetical protein
MVEATPFASDESISWLAVRSIERTMKLAVEL